MADNIFPPVDSEDFIQAVSGVVNASVQTGGRAELLNNGDQFFPAILKAIDEARDNINFMVYIWTAGQIADVIFDALIKKAKEGIEVRMVFDSFGAMKAPNDRIVELELAGGRICWYRPIRLGKLTRFYKRNHRRAIIVDGRVGFLGGAAIEDKWLGNAQDPDHWRDSMVRVIGSMAENLQSAFSQIWADTTGEILAGKRFYPDQDSDRRNQNDTKHVSVISAPGAEFHPMSNVYYITFKAARKTLYITHSYFVPDKSLRKALAEKAQSGVDVRVLLPNKYIDGKPIRWASHYYFEELLRSGIRIFEYQPTMIHSKSVVVDGRWSIVGSANLDVRSLELNKENVLGILDSKFAESLQETFLEDLKYSEEIKLGHWKHRNPLLRVREWFASLFEEQY